MLVLEKDESTSVSLTHSATAQQPIVLCVIILMETCVTNHESSCSDSWRRSTVETTYSKEIEVDADDRRKTGSSVYH